MIKYKIIVIEENDKANVDPETGYVYDHMPSLERKIIEMKDFEEGFRREELEKAYKSIMNKYSIQRYKDPDMKVKLFDRFYAFLMLLRIFKTFFITNILGIGEKVEGLYYFTPKRISLARDKIAEYYWNNEDNTTHILWGRRLILLGAGRKYEGDKNEGAKAANFQHVYMLWKFILKGYNTDYLKRAEKYMCNW